MLRRLRARQLCRRRGAEEPRREPAPPRLVLRFALGTALLLALAAAGILAVVRHYDTVQAERSAARHAQFVAASVLAPALEAGDASGPVDASRRQELDRLFETQVLLDGALLAELATADGTVVYATDHARIGSQIADAGRLAESASGAIVSDVVATEDARWADGATDVLRTFTPIPLVRGEAPVVLVLRQDYGPIADAARAAFLPVVGILELMLALLLIVLVPLMARASLRIGRQMERIEYQASHDHVTGLANRVLLRNRALALARGKRAPNAGVAMLTLDIDRFKDVNDTLGHEAGDELICALAQRLERALGPGATVARLGGDEFGAIFDYAARDDVDGALARIEQELATPIEIRGVAIAVETSVGVALLPEHASDVDTLMQRADMAMHAAKDRRLGACVFEDAHDTGDPGRLSLLAELRRAIRERELVLEFQPKSHLATGEIRGVEALVRWQHPARGRIPPGEFIPYAERTGIVRPLSRYLLAEALGQLAGWGERAAGMTVAVNLSAHDLLDDRLPTEIADAVASTGVRPDQLEIEITETAVMTDPELIVETLGRISALGVRIAIDDFGTGFSSLSYLKQLSVDTLKIDQSFIRSMHVSRDDETIVHSTIDLAHSLGLTVVAEGVELDAHWEMLAEMGCDLAQGYLISRPLPSAEIVELLDASRGPERRAA